MKKMGIKKFMWRIMFFVALSLFAFQPFANAQNEEITDEDLKGYAVIKNAVDLITKSISPAVNDLIKKQEGMTGQRFQELRKAGSTEQSLKAAGAQDWEVKFMMLVNDMIKERTQAAQDVVELLINNTNMTVAKYTAIKNGLESNNDLKARYEQLAN